METGVSSDKGIGFAVLFSVVTLFAVAVMLAVDDQLTTAIGFAAAMVAACLAVAGTHIYG
ncbi:hypothetical protein SAMN04488063_1295 [Halopelagius inordinatus]|uniref:Uncharacterized protein n=1 Tax=Halopelagius inordinatus TaxID=553467 RepID=A0A1I2NWA7_9EURY|nr:hypothetical protein [Halopelagius inordinatus]SFG05927.1 hypothetical protein SAMN04488063_1295 [Halopelagius inordinatus]